MMAATSTIPSYGIFIDGAAVPGSSGETRESIDPATERVWAVVPEAGTEDVDHAVAAARRALKGPWGELAPRARGRVLRRIAEQVEAQAERLIALELRDNGKTVRDLAAQYAL